MVSMRSTNDAIGMPFEAFHWGAIQIPFVVNHHLHKEEREAAQNTKPYPELEYSLDHLDNDDRRSIIRSIGAVEEIFREEAVRSIQCLLERELVAEERVLGAARRIEELSRSGSLETTRAVKAILYILKERGVPGG